MAAIFLDAAQMTSGDHGVPESEYDPSTRRKLARRAAAAWADLCAFAGRADLAAGWLALDGLAVLPAVGRVWAEVAAVGAQDLPTAVELLAGVDGGPAALASLAAVCAHHGPRSGELGPLLWNLWMPVLAFCSPGAVTVRRRAGGESTEAAPELAGLASIEPEKPETKGAEATVEEDSDGEAPEVMASGPRAGRPSIREVKRQRAKQMQEVSRSTQTALRDSEVLDSLRSTGGVLIRKLNPGASAADTQQYQEMLDGLLTKLPEAMNGDLVQKGMDLMSGIGAGSPEDLLRNPARALRAVQKSGLMESLMPSAPAKKKSKSKSKARRAAKK